MGVACSRHSLSRVPILPDAGRHLIFDGIGNSDGIVHKEAGSRKKVRNQLGLIDRKMRELFLALFRTNKSARFFDRSFDQDRRNDPDFGRFPMSEAEDGCNHFDFGVWRMQPVHQ